MRSMSINFDVRKTTVRKSSVIVTEDGKEVFAIEEDGTVIGSIHDAFRVCEEMPKYSRFDQTLPKVMIGVLRALLAR